MNNIVFREDGTILVKNVRLSYPHLFKKWAGETGGDPKYSARFLLDKVTHAAEINALKSHLVKMMKEAFKGNIPLDKLFFRDGAGSGKEEQENTWSISASEQKAPDVINKDKSRINEEDDIVYAGCYVNVLIRPWVQKNKFGKRINANLLAVQFVKDGERFSGVERPDTDDVFDDVSEDFDDGAGSSSEVDPFAE